MATIKNVDRLISKLNNISNMELKDAMVQATKIVHAQAKILAPVATGNLAGSIHQEVRKSGKNIEGCVFTNLQYAPYVEFGTGSSGKGTYPYDPKGLSLSYCETPWIYTPNGGENFYYTHGQVAKPYMYPALKQNEKYIRKLFKAGLYTKLKQNSKGGK